MPKRLKRYYGSHDLHFITFSCYRRRKSLNTPRDRDAFLRVLEQVRRYFDFTVVGYVVMPEHVHLLLSEPAMEDLSRVMQSLKQRVAQKLLPDRRRTPNASQGELFPGSNASPDHFWQKRFYDFIVWTAKKEREKLVYMHRNPVKRGLVAAPEDWRWSSYRTYAFGEKGLVAINEPSPTLRQKQAKGWGTPD